MYDIQVFNYIVSRISTTGFQRVETGAYRTTCTRLKPARQAGREVRGAGVQGLPAEG
eukprot:COSAG04_NODE_15694_length_523_cov_1.219340_2_plen_56_part_01